jgi:membrane-associated HD superfamily phosphohydrolase
MLSRTLDAAGRFTRRDAVRLVVSAVVLIAALTVTLGFDIFSPALELRAGDVAPVSVRAPRAVTFESAIRTEAKREDAAKAVEPQYDYTEENAAAISDAQVASFRREARVVDAAFALDDPLARRDALGRAFPELSADARAARVSGRRSGTRSSSRSGRCCRLGSRCRGRPARSSSRPSWSPRSSSRTRRTARP